MSGGDAGGDAGLTVYTLEDLAKHASKKDCWMAVNGKVYDVTGFLEDHPGGPDIMLEHAGARGGTGAAAAHVLRALCGRHDAGREARSVRRAGRREDVATPQVLQLLTNAHVPSRPCRCTR
jgi:hypothetical protein